MGQQDQRFEVTVRCTPDTEHQARQQAKGVPPAEVLRQGGSEFVESALQTWQPRAPRLLTAEDAREIVENTVGFFTVLAEWDQGESQTDTPQTEGVRHDERPGVPPASSRTSPTSIDQPPEGTTDTGSTGA